MLEGKSILVTGGTGSLGKTLVRRLLKLTDSGTVQEECAIFGVPNVTLRDVTERPETLECGSNLIAGADPEDVRRAVHTVLTTHRPWTAPAEYRVDNVSARVVKILTSRRGP